jgi:hypothetical protein
LVIVVVSLRTRFSEEEEKRTRKDRELYQWKMDFYYKIKLLPNVGVSHTATLLPPTTSAVHWIESLTLISNDYIEQECFQFNKLLDLDVVFVTIEVVLVFGPQHVSKRETHQPCALACNRLNEIRFRAFWLVQKGSHLRVMIYTVSQSHSIRN